MGMPRPPNRGNITWKKKTKWNKAKIPMEIWKGMLILYFFPKSKSEPVDIKSKLSKIILGEIIMLQGKSKGVVCSLNHWMVS